MSPSRDRVAAPRALIRRRLSSVSSIVLMNSNSVQHASIQEVYAAVAGATSQNPKEMSASAARLKDLMDQAGALDLLQQIAAQKTAPLHIRQLSIIQVKNAVSTLWRSRRSVDSVRCLPWRLSKTWFYGCQAGSRRPEARDQESLLDTARRGR
jgi:hypothetical protein